MLSGTLDFADPRVRNYLAEPQSAEANAAWVRRKVAEQGWTWNICGNAYFRLKPGLSTLVEKLTLYSIIRELSCETEAEYHG